MKRLTLLADSDDDLMPNVEIVTNETTVELFRFMNDNPTCTLFTLRKWLAQMLGAKEAFPTVNSIRQSILRVSGRLSKLKKMPRSEKKDVANYHLF